jgi:hypothetical protein
MIQLTMTVYCSVCGISAEVNKDITLEDLPSDVVVSARLLQNHAQKELENKGWAYIDCCDEFVCRDCDNGPVILRVDARLIAEKGSMRPEALFNAVKYEVAHQLGVDSDVLNANMVGVKAYINPQDLAVTYYLTPIGMKWSDIKKRYSREPEIS